MWDKIKNFCKRVAAGIGGTALVGLHILGSPIVQIGTMIGLTLAFGWLGLGIALAIEVFVFVILSMIGEDEYPGLINDLWRFAMKGGV